MIRECIAQFRNVSHHRAACFERRIEPFVRIDGDGVRLIETGELVCGLGRNRSQRSIRPIDMKPEPEFPAERGQLCQWIDCTGADSSRIADDEEWLVARVDVLTNAQAQAFN